MRTFILIAACLCSLQPAFAQSITKPVERQSMGIVYDRETAGDFRLHTRGFAASIIKGKLLNYDKTSYYKVGIGELRHPKEVKMSLSMNNLSNSPSARSFVFGKQNAFIPVRVSFGRKRYLSEKAQVRGLAVGYSFEGGATFGVLKPYYLKIKYFGDDNLSFIYRDERYEPAINRRAFLDQNSIVGASSFFKGIEELSIVPGINAQIAAHFDWGAYDEYVRALEVGFMLDLFPRSVPIMIETENTPLFLNLFLSLQLGKRN